MTSVKEIEAAVQQLPKKSLAEFRKWFEDFDAAIWDAQFEHDAQTGQLDGLAEQAVKSFRSKRCTEL